MKTKLIGFTLFILTVTGVAYYPQIMANTIKTNTPIENSIDILSQIPNELDTGAPSLQHLTDRPIIDVVFVLDTTGSMGGLIKTAKEKIWSIATTMASAQQTPDIRIGLVAYRDRQDSYVTKVVDLSSDLDSVYATLMDFEANGGGDHPESVNKALYDAVHAMSWSSKDNAYQAIFLVGDAPPHMDYNEVRYPEIVATAREKGIVVNTIQCGSHASTIEPWTQIASLSHGNYFEVEQAGGAVAFTTPYDKEIAELSAQLDDTRLYFGSKSEREKMKGKVAATEKIHSRLSLSSRARRAEFNNSASGKKNQLGEKELVSAVAEGKVALEELDRDLLPESLQAMAPVAQSTYVAELSEKRKDLQNRIRVLSKDRSGYLSKKVDDAGGLKDSLDQKLYEAVKSQADKAGLVYEDGPAY